jgi:oligopeptide transport system ATP-binding protein
VTGVAATGAPTTSVGGKTLVEVKDLKVWFPITEGIVFERHIGDVRAVDGVSFTLRRGETLGLVGESGCGKSTTGRAMIRLNAPTEGSITFDGIDLASLSGPDLRRIRRRMQMIFQDPYSSLNPRMTAGGIVGEPLDIHAIGSRQERRERVRELMSTVGLNPDFVERYPHEFSGGQRQRIGIARALALDPEFVVCDEPVSALDVSIQSQILNLLLDLRREFNLTYLFIAHNLSVVQYISDRVGVMYLGKIMELATVAQLYARPRHPYTVALLSAVPDPDPRIRKKRLVLEGDVPSPAAPPSGCRFHTRCWLRKRLGNPENCETEVPELRDIGDGHQVACHWAEEVPETLVAQAVPTVEAAPPGFETTSASPTQAGTGAPGAPIAAASSGFAESTAVVQTGGGSANPGA